MSARMAELKRYVQEADKLRRRYEETLRLRNKEIARLRPEWSLQELAKATKLSVPRIVQIVKRENA